MRTIPNRLSCGAIAAIALFGCWDSVATPIRAPADGGLDAGDAPDAAVADFGGVPDTFHCEPVAEWPAESAEAELALFNALNELRGHPRCGGREFNDLPPLRLAPALRCSARLHSRDMVTRGFFNKINPDDETPDQRVAETGFQYYFLEESIVSGGSDYARVLDDLRESREDCFNLFDPRFDVVGIGFHKERWTLDFAGFGGP